MYANLRCENCGLTQQVPMGPGPSMAACTQCGGAMQVPGAASAMPMYPQPQQYAQRPQPMQGYPRQGYYPYPPPRTSNNAGLIVGLAIAGFVVLVIGSAVFGAISELDKIESTPPEHRISTPGESPVYRKPKFRSWLMRTSSEGHFAIDMPGKPIESERTLRNDEGRLTSHRLTCREDEAEWQVEYWDFPEHGPEDDAYSLAGEIDVLAEVHGCQPDVEKEITLKSSAGETFAGREVRFAALDDDVYVYRIYCVRNRMYLVCALTLAGVKNTEQQRFHDSFRLIGNIPKEGWKASYLPEPSKEDRGTVVPKSK